MASKLIKRRLSDRCTHLLGPSHKLDRKEWLEQVKILLDDYEKSGWGTSPSLNVLRDLLYPGILAQSKALP